MPACGYCGIGTTAYRTRQPLCQLSGQCVKIFIICRNVDVQLLLRFHFLVAGDLLRVVLRLFGVKEVATHAVKGLAVLDLVVVCTGMMVDMPAQVQLVAKKAIDWPRGIGQWRQGVIGSEATVVLYVVGEQRGSWGEDGR